MKAVLLALAAKTVLLLEVGQEVQVKVFPARRVRMIQHLAQVLILIRDLTQDLALDHRMIVDLRLEAEVGRRRSVTTKTNHHTLDPAHMTTHREKDQVVKMMQTIPTTVASHLGSNRDRRILPPIERARKRQGGMTTMTSKQSCTVLYQKQQINMNLILNSFFLKF